MLYAISKFFLILAIVEVYKNEGDDEFRNNEFSNAIHFYTEGIKVNCKDDELNTKLYSNRATAHFHLGKILFSFVSKTSLCCMINHRNI